MKRKYIIIAVIAVLCFAIGIGAGFIAGRKSNDNSVILPSVEIADFQLNDFLSGSYATNDSIDEEYLMNNYGMSKNDAESVKSNPEEWLGFNIFVNIGNGTGKDIYISNLALNKTGKDGAYIFCGNAGIVGISAGSAHQYTTSVLIRNNELSTDEARSLIEEIGLSAVFTLTNELTEGESYTAATK